MGQAPGDEGVELSVQRVTRSACCTSTHTTPLTIWSLAVLLVMVRIDASGRWTSLFLKFGIIIDSNKIKINHNKQIRLAFSINIAPTQGIWRQYAVLPWYNIHLFLGYVKMYLCSKLYFISRFYHFSPGNASNTIPMPIYNL